MYTYLNTVYEFVSAQFINSIFISSDGQYDLYYYIILKQVILNMNRDSNVCIFLLCQLFDLLFCQIFCIGSLCFIRYDSMKLLKLWLNEWTKLNSEVCKIKKHYRSVIQYHF